MALLPTILVALPFTVLVIFTLNVLLVEFGAADLSGAGAALGSVTQIGPLVTVLIVAGAGATAICADLGARTIREGDRRDGGLGHRSGAPVGGAARRRVVRGGPAAQRASRRHRPRWRILLLRLRPAREPGAYVSSLTLVTGLPEVIISEIKAGTFGLIAALVACYRGLTVSGGPKGVGTAVNETVVYAFMALFAVNVVLTAVG